MANYYVYSGATGAANGSSWADAFTTLSAAMTWAVGGDFVYVANDHNNIVAGANSLSSAGVKGNPVFVVCVNRAGSVPPVAADMVSSPSGIEGTSGANAYGIGGSVHVHGMDFRSATLSGSQSFVFSFNGGDDIVLEKCAVRLMNTGGSAVLSFGGSGASGTRVVLLDTSIHFGQASQRINFRNVDFLWRGGSIGTTAVTSLIAQAGSSLDRGCNARFEGVDFSLLTGTIFNSHQSLLTAQFNNCRFSATTWASIAALASRPSVVGSFLDFVNCGSGAVNYDSRRVTYQGDVTVDTAVKLAGSDGTTGYSLKAVTTANANISSPLELFEIVEWIDSPGPKTVEVEVITDGVALTDADVFMTVMALDNASYPTTGRYTTRKPLVGAPSALGSSTAAWTHGLASPQKFKLTKGSIPVEMKGCVRVLVFVAKPSTTVYVEPKVSIT